MHSEDWTRYFDDESQSFYFYNASTGESKWDEAVDTASTHAGAEMYSLQKSKVPVSTLRDFKHTADTLKSSVRIVSTGRNNAYESDEEGDDVNDDDAGEGVLAPSAQFLSSTSSSSSLPSRRVNSTNRSYRALLQFDFIVLLVNAVLIEAPLCIVEGLLRCTVLSVLYLSLLCYPRYNSSNPFHTLTVSAILEDVIFSLSAVAVLCIPGAILIIYRNYVDDEWEVGPLPTLIGWSDMRRFGTVTVLGNASLASNMDTTGYPSGHNNRDGSGDDGSENSDDDGKDRNRYSHRKQDVLWKCIQQFFPQPSESLIFVPHEMIRRCNNYLQAID